MVTELLETNHWLLFEGGVLEIQGHAASILKRLEAPHFISGMSINKCLGASKVEPRDISTAFLPHPAMGESDQIDLRSRVSRLWYCQFVFGLSNSYRSDETP